MLYAICYMLYICWLINDQTAWGGTEKKVRDVNMQYAILYTGMMKWQIEITLIAQVSDVFQPEFKNVPVIARLCRSPSDGAVKKTNVDRWIDRPCQHQMSGHIFENHHVYTTFENHQWLNQQQYNSNWNVIYGANHKMAMTRNTRWQYTWKKIVTDKQKSHHHHHHHH